MPDRYAPQHARARVFAPSARWPVFVLVPVVVWFGGNLILGTGFDIWTNSPGAQSNPARIDALIDASTPWAVRWTLGLFAVYVALLLLCTRVFHGLSLTNLTGPPRSVWRSFWRVSLYLLPLYAIFTVPSLWAPEVYQNLDLFRWLILLPTVLPFLFIQIATEELVFRGYLQSHAAALSRHPLVWMLIPSVLFGLIHYDSFAPAYSAWSYVAWATALGLVCADLTARVGHLGPALAVHFVNNIFAMLVLAADD